MLYCDTETLRFPFSESGKQIQTKRAVASTNCSSYLIYFILFINFLVFWTIWELWCRTFVQLRSL